jgi:hypothetical protein
VSIKQLAAETACPEVGHPIRPPVPLRREYRDAWKDRRSLPWSNGHLVLTAMACKLNRNDLYKFRSLEQILESFEPSLRAAGLLEALVPVARIRRYLVHLKFTGGALLIGHGGDLRST